MLPFHKGDRITITTTAGGGERVKVSQPGLAEVVRVRKAKR